MVPSFFGFVSFLFCSYSFFRFLLERRSKGYGWLTLSISAFLTWCVFSYIYGVLGHISLSTFLLSLSFLGRIEFLKPKTFPLLLFSLLLYATYFLGGQNWGQHSFIYHWGYGGAEVSILLVGLSFYGAIYNTQLLVYLCIALIGWVMSLLPSKNFWDYIFDPFFVCTLCFQLFYRLKQRYPLFNFCFSK